MEHRFDQQKLAGRCVVISEISMLENFFTTVRFNKQKYLRDNIGTGIRIKLQSKIKRVF